MQQNKLEWFKNYKMLKICQSNDHTHAVADDADVWMSYKKVADAIAVSNTDIYKSGTA